MTDVFPIYFQLGFEHITDVAGYDHILFIISLCAAYKPAEWRQLLILVTAFTIGHSITLAMAAFGVIGLSQPLIEFLVPITIMLTALYQAVFFREKSSLMSRQVGIRYLLALFFGLIHGMAFSNFFRSSMFPGEESQLVWQLLAFNLGVEAGQLLIVAIILGIATLLLNVLRVPQREWALFISGMAFGPSLIMAAERWSAVFA